MVSPPAISVIVPVYNVEKTLRRCLDSILAQTFTDYEVILVNDSSKDSSGAICDEYVEKYSNFCVIHKENEGLGPTRNAGIRKACGEYLYHCDSDDWLKTDLLATAYQAISSNNADVCIFGYEIFDGSMDELTPFGKVTLPNGRFSKQNEVRKFFVEHYHNSFSVLTACNRLSRRAFILDNDIWFPDLRRAQDIAYSFELFDKLTNLVTIEDTLYCYVIEPGVFKGRSYDEMIDIYMQINKKSCRQFQRWKLLDKRQETLLNNLTCENIANYSSYAMIVKYPEQNQEILEKLVSNQAVVNLMKGYRNEKHSLFMRLFSLAICFHSKRLLYAICKWHERRRGGK